MIRAALTAALVLTLIPVKAEVLWLVIGASDSKAVEIAAKAKSLSTRFPGSLVVQTTDCGEKKNVFAWAAELVHSEEAAQPALNRLKDTNKDAYLKRCTVKKGSLLDVRVAAVDPSIANVPATAVNWEDKDRVSSVERLADGRFLGIIRYYADVAEDPLEGRRQRVVLLEAPDTWIVLEEQCMSPGPVTTYHRRVAFACAREQAGDLLLHTTVAYDAAGKKLAEVQHCRDPQWITNTTISCKVESVAANGKLKLRAKKIELKK